MPHRMISFVSLATAYIQTHSFISFCLHSSTQSEGKRERERTWEVPLWRFPPRGKINPFLSFFFASLSLFLTLSFCLIIHTTREKEKGTWVWQSFLRGRRIFLEVFSLPVRSRIASYSWSIVSVCAYIEREKERKIRIIRMKKERMKRESDEIYFHFNIRIWSSVICVEGIRESWTYVHKGNYHLSLL